MSTKIRRIVSLDEDMLIRLDEAKNILHKKSRNDVIVEAIDNLLKKLSGLPKNVNEAILSSYGASNTIKNMREETNASFKKRSAR